MSIDALVAFDVWPLFVIIGPACCIFIMTIVWVLKRRIHILTLVLSIIVMVVIALVNLIVIYTTIAGATA